MPHKFYWNPLCPFVHRSWISAIEKNATKDLEFVFIALGPEKPDWYEKEINPRGTIPALKTENGRMVFESNYVSY